MKASSPESVPIHYSLNTENTERMFVRRRSKTMKKMEEQEVEERGNETQAHTHRQDAFRDND